MLPCLCGSIGTTEALKALVLDPQGSAATLRAKTLGAFLRLDRTGHEAMRLAGAATNKTCAPTDKTARSLIAGTSGTEEHRWYGG
jgi:hypothetical protein